MLFSEQERYKEEHRPGEGKKYLWEKAPELLVIGNAQS